MIKTAKGNPDTIKIVLLNFLLLYIIIFIFFGCVLTALGIFDKLVCFLKSALIIPITGFAHSITSAALDYKQDGFVTGIGSNCFKLAGSVILYGVVSAFILVIIGVVING